jgi:hypothetical protein
VGNDLEIGVISLATVDVRRSGRSAIVLSVSQCDVSPANCSYPYSFLPHPLTSSKEITDLII